MTDPRSLYHATIVKHDRSPLHEGPLPDATRSVTLDNPLCGDEVTVHVVLEGQVVRAATFEARGCALARAAASIATDRAIGRTATEIRAMSEDVTALVRGAPGDPVPSELGDAEAFAGVRSFKSRRTCVTLAYRALASCLDV